MTNPIDIQLGDALNTSGTSAQAVLDDDVEKVTFLDYFKKENDKIERRQWSVWEPIYLRHARFMLYYDYQQVILKPPGRKGYITQKVEEKDKVWMFNSTKRYVDEIASMWLSVAPKGDFTLKGEGMENQQTKLEGFTSLNDYFNIIHLTPLYVQTLAKYGIGFGSYYGECSFNPNNGKGTEIEAQFNDVEMPGYDATMCKVCNHIADGAQAGCESCGSPLVQNIQVPGVNGRVVTGEAAVPKGEIEDRLHLPCQIRYSLVTGFDNSSYLYIEDEVLKEKIQQEYGKKSVAKANNRLHYDDLIYPVRMLRQAERAEIGGFMTNADDDDEGVLVQRFFREPELLHYVSLSEPYDAPGYGTIPAGVRLSEVFPKGMSIKRVKGEDTFLEVKAGSYHDSFTQGVFSLTPGRTDPQGAKELPEMNKVGNMLKSGMLVHLLKFMNPSVVVADEIFGKEALFNRQDPAIRVPMAKLAAFQTGIQGAMGFMNPPAMAPAMFPAIQMLEAAAQDAGKAQTQDSADPNVNADTATAWKIGEGRFTRNSGLYMSGYGQYLTEHTPKKMQLAKDNYGDLRQIACTDEDGNRTAILLKKTDIEAEVSFSIRDESLQPNLKLEKREAAKQAGDYALNLIKAGITITPNIERQINKNFGSDIKFNDEEERIEECEEQLENARNAMGQMGMIDPQAGAMQLYMQDPVDYNRLGHDEQINWWREWLSSSEGRKAEPILQTLAQMYIAAHSAAQANQAGFVMAKAQEGLPLVQNMPPPPPMPIMPGALGQPMPPGAMPPPQGPPQGMPANA